MVQYSRRLPTSYVGGAPGSEQSERADERVRRVRGSFELFSRYDAPRQGHAQQ